MVGGIKTVPDMQDDCDLQEIADEYRSENEEEREDSLDGNIELEIEIDSYTWTKQEINKDSESQDAGEEELSTLRELDVEEEEFIDWVMSDKGLLCI